MTLNGEGVAGSAVEVSMMVFSVCAFACQRGVCDNDGACIVHSAYGYEHSDGFTGVCVRDSSVTLDPICTEPNAISYMKSQGYQKVAGDVCVGGVQQEFLPIETACREYSVTTSLFSPYISYTTSKPCPI